MNERSRSYPRAAAANEFHAKTFESSTETSLNYAIQRALRILPDGTLDAIWPEHRATRSQDLEPAYHDAGQFYWGRTSAFRERREILARIGAGHFAARARARYRHARRLGERGARLHSPTSRRRPPPVKVVIRVDADKTGA